MPIELEIQRVIREEPTLKEAAHFFVQKIAAPETTDAERFAYWNFLFHAGFYREILTSMCHRLHEKQKVHWGVFVETLGRVKAVPSNSTITAVFKGIKRQHGAGDLWGAHSWDEYDPAFGEQRKSFHEAQLKIGADRRGSLVEKFQFLHSQRLHDQAGQIIKRLIFLYPGDQELHRMRASYDEEWARNVLSDKVYNIREEDHLPPALSVPQAEIVKVWLEAVPAKGALDFAIFFLLADADDAALAAARKAARSASTDWLVAEILLRLRRYVDLLEHLQSIEGEYLADPETAFGVAYLRAQALKELGQSAAAVEILRSIVQVRPNYRSAGHLISEWSMGAAG